MMVVEVTLLTGRYVATRYNDRDRAEWPPHPARLFSAAVAAWADADEPSDSERDALRWWETLGPPEISCSWGDRWSERAPVTHYVPDNDTQVVQRDTSKTYTQLRASIDVSLIEENDAKIAARRAKQLGKAQAKATADSVRVASAGTAPESALKVLPDNRGRQARVYPTAVPERDTVTYAWPEADANDPRPAILDVVLSRIARLGHSSSLVAVALTHGEKPGSQVPADAGGATVRELEQGRATTLVQAEGGQVAVRVASAGQMDLLEQAFASHQGVEPRTLPAEILSYGPAGEAPVPAPTSVFSETWIVLEPVDRRFTVRDTLALTRTLRKALMSRSPGQPAPEMISGHLPRTNGDPTAPTERAHLAIAALPFVAHRYADGSMHALAILLPNTASGDERAAVLQAIGRWMDDDGGSATLQLGRAGTVSFRRSIAEDAPVSARPERWMRPSRHWASVTPVALDRHPGDLNHREPAKRDAASERAAELVRASCRHIGLPEPAKVDLRFDAPVSGTRKARAFPAYTVKNGKLRRTLVHVSLTFDQPVKGPVLIGAGRYLGYGLCVPLAEPKTRAGK